MTKFQQAFYLTQQIRDCERKAYHELGLSEDALMERAGNAAFASLKILFPHAKSIVIFCGNGNNAGDGFVLARLAYQQGLIVTIYTGKFIEELPLVAKRAAFAAIEIGVPCYAVDDYLDCEADVIVDALLGIGVQGEVHGVIAHAINLINEAKCPVLSIDLPSGLQADTGKVLGICVQAAVTVTFIAPKLGLYTADGPDYCGQVICNDLGLERCIASLTPIAHALDGESLRALLKSRPKNSFKAQYGHVLIIGGGVGMPGAVYLAALAAFRTGAGTVTIATRPEHTASALPMLPEAMLYPIHETEDLAALLKRASVCVIGPGLGEDEWARALFATTVASPLPMVIDASALRLLANYPQYDDHWILTPHPGEAAALLQCSTTQIQDNRLVAAQRLQAQYGGTVILKGVGSIIQSQTDSYICVDGNPGMSSAGMGDVLSGIIAGLLAQKLSLEDAARLGVWLHAKSGDDAALFNGERGLLASDIMPHLRKRINPI